VTASGIAYGTPHVFDNNGNNYLLSGGDLSITITDDASANCDLQAVEILAPQICGENYICDEALTISGPGTYTAIGPDQGAGGSNIGQNANWFVYVPSTHGLLSINSCMNGVNTRLHLHSGSCENLTLLLTSDDDCAINTGGGSFASEIVDYCVDPNTTYFIEWDDFASTEGFDFDLSLTVNSYYEDMDGDGFGDAASSLDACSIPAGYVADNTDCDDNDATNYPGNTEICDGKDNNCDNVIDEGCSNLPICDDVYLVINTISQNIYRAEINISSDAAIAGGSPILFTAGTDIDLEPLFEVALGTEFEASIEPCQPGPSSIAAEFFDSNNSLEDLERFFEKPENKGKKLRIRVITEAGKTIFQKVGGDDTIPEVKELVNNHQEANLIITLKFLDY